MASLFALLIGIDSYPYVNKLVSCHRDVAAMSTLLHTHLRTDLTLNESILLNEKATKSQVSSTIWSHLGKAKAGDVALLYFSGHGCREEADPIWCKLDNDRALETLVCYDYGALTGNGGLSDKELRFLLANVAANGANVITIYDCCHSGDATRGDLYLKRIITEKARPLTSVDGKQDTVVEPMRAWENFLFHKNKPRRLFETAKSLIDVLPLPPHIHIAACRDVEEAYQTETGSLLTETLIDVVKRSGSNLTYGQLKSRIANLTRGRYPQTPQIQVVDPSPQALNQTFMGGLIEPTPEKAEINWNEVSKRWILNRGALHGLQKNDAITIEVLNDEGQLLSLARLIKVQLDHSFVKIDDPNALKSSTIAGVTSSKKWFTARIKGMYRQPVQFFLEGSVRGLDLLKREFENHQADFDRLNIAFTQNVLLADFCVVAFVDNDYREQYFITLPKQRPEPTAADVKESLVRPLKTFAAEAPQVAAYLKHIANWQFVRKLTKPQSTLPADWIEVTCFTQQNGQFQPIAFTTNEDGTKTAELLAQLEGQRAVGRIRFRLTNKAQHQPLHVSMVFLSSTFEVQPRLIDTLSYELRPAGERGDSTEVLRNQPINLNFDKPEQLSLPTRPFSMARFLLIVGTDPFDVSAFAQSSLWQDDNRGQALLRHREVDRIIRDDWNTQLYEVVVLPHVKEP